MSMSNRAFGKGVHEYYVSEGKIWVILKENRCEVVEGKGIKKCVRVHESLHFVGECASARMPVGADLLPTFSPVCQSTTGCGGWY